MILFWDALQCNVCIVPDVSRMGPNGREAPHHLDTGLEYISQMARKAVKEAHRFSCLAREVDMSDHLRRLGDPERGKLRSSLNVGSASTRLNTGVCLPNVRETQIWLKGAIAIRVYEWAVVL